LLHNSKKAASPKVWRHGFILGVGLGGDLPSHVRRFLRRVFLRILRRVLSARWQELVGIWRIPWRIRLSLGSRIAGRWSIRTFRRGERLRGCWWSRSVYRTVR